ncbi:MAG: helix-turn-helix transcriptional regulator [Terriglobales bacterium]
MALMNAIDEALLDECRWPAVSAGLTQLFPQLAEQAPSTFPSGEEIQKLQQLAAIAAWSRADAELFGAVCSHLETAAKLRSETRLSQVKWRAALRALDHLGRGVLLVDRTARVLFANTAARTVLGERDGLYLQEEHLMATRANHNVQLREALQAVASQASPSAELAIPRPSLRQLLTLLLTPASARLEKSSGNSGMDELVLVFVNDPERKLAVNPSTLSRMYGLTRSEAQLACHILAGESLEEAARALEITANTARTHLKRIFLKTDTNRQSQLILLLMGNASAGEPSSSGKAALVPALATAAAACDRILDPVGMGK